MNHLFRENLKKLLIFILVCMLSLGAFFCLYSHDNKYTARSVSDRNGITGLDSDTLNKGKAAFLVEGWDRSIIIFLFINVKCRRQDNIASTASTSPFAAISF